MNGADQYNEDGDRPYLRAAHYFSDGWALNFWQIVDPRKVAAELRTIKTDGFNAIILVLPWRGVQADLITSRFEEFYFQQLRMVLAAAHKCDLAVILRLSYGHHVLPHAGATAFSDFQRLLYEADSQDAWLEYLRRVEKIAGKHSAVIGLFLSWEEFWIPLSSLQDRAQSAREYMARKLGYTAWLRERDIADIDAIPPRGSEHYHLYHRFKNEKIRALFELARAAVPRLSMEVRVDKDPQPHEHDIEWLENDDYRDVQAIRYSYWAPFMGAANRGETLDAEAAAGLLEHMLTTISRQGHDRRHIVDQFNFVDDTHDASGQLARLEPTALAEFLQRARPLLRKYAAGYGLWAVRDYRLNVLYNARFLMGMAGWQCLRGQVLNRYRRAGIYLARGSLIRQQLASPVSALQRDIMFDEFEFELSLRTPLRQSQLRLRLNAGDWIDLEVDSAGLLCRARVPILHGDIWENGISLLLENQGGGVQVDSVSLFHQCYQVGIRQLDGSPGPLLELVRELNRED